MISNNEEGKCYKNVCIYNQWGSRERDTNGVEAFYLAEDGLDDGGAGGVGLGHVHGLELLPESGMGGGVAAAEATVAAEGQLLRQNNRHPCACTKSTETSSIPTHDRVA